MQKEGTELFIATHESALGSIYGGINRHVVHLVRLADRRTMRRFRFGALLGRPGEGDPASYRGTEQKGGTGQAAG